MTRLFLSALSGALLACAFPPHAIFPLALCGLIPLLIAARDAPIAARLTYGFTCGVAFHICAFWWLAPTIQRLQVANVAIGVPASVAFSAYQGLQLGIFAMVVSSGSMSGALATSSGWVIIEAIYPKILPWYLGDPLGSSPILRQLADLTGVQGLSFFSLLINALLAQAITRHGRSAVARLGAVGLLIAAASAYGNHAGTIWDSVSESHNVHVAIVQGGISASTVPLDFASLNDNLWTTHERLSLAGPVPEDSGLRLTVWPETSVRSYLDEDNDDRRRAESLARRLNHAVLIGALDRSDDGLVEFNTAYLFGPDGNHQKYRKTVLVPFGEYVPAAMLFQFAPQWRVTGRFSPGEDRPLMALTDVVRFATLICFEAAWTGSYLDQVRNGAGLLVNVSDDSWFQSEAEAQAHLNATRLRAVELRRWLVRATDSGISAVIDPEGEIVASMGWGEVGVLRTMLVTDTRLSTFARSGNWLLTISSAHFALLFLRALAFAGRRT